MRTAHCAKLSFFIGQTVRKFGRPSTHPIHQGIRVRSNLGCQLAPFGEANIARPIWTVNLDSKLRFLRIDIGISEDAREAAYPDVPG